MKIQAIALMILFLVGGGRVDAITMTDLAGTWSSSAKSVLSIAGVGTLRGTVPITCSVTATSTVAGSFLCDQSGFGTVASGSATLISNGNVVTLLLDLNGVAAIESGITKTIDQVAAQKGLTLDMATVEYDVRTLTFVPIKVVNNLPTKGKIKMTGFVAAMISGRHYRRKFSYSATVTFQTKTQ